MIDATELYPTICSNLAGKRKIYISDKLYGVLEKAIADGKVYLTIRKDKRHGWSQRGALFYMIFRSQLPAMLKDEFATYHRILLRYDGLYHLHVIKLYTNPQQYIYMMPTDSEDVRMENPACQC